MIEKGDILILEVWPTHILVYVSRRMSSVLFPDGKSKKFLDIQSSIENSMTPYGIANLVIESSGFQCSFVEKREVRQKENCSDIYLFEAMSPRDA
jgi:hypothetical protein